MSFAKPFTEHPASVNETYGQDFVSAMSFSGSMLWAGICCAIHAFLPFLFETKGKCTILSLHDRMVLNRVRQPIPARPSADC